MFADVESGLIDLSGYNVDLPDLATLDKIMRGLDAGVSKRGLEHHNSFFQYLVDSNVSSDEAIVRLQSLNKYISIVKALIN